MIITILLLLACLSAQAQRNEIYNERIRTVQVVVNNDWLAMPVMTLGGNDLLEIKFDDLTHDYHRYVYKVEHCEADWTISKEIFESAYLEGFNGATFEDVAMESLNTTVLYSHYNIRIPNGDCRLKMSGNYRLTVYDEDAGEAMFCACFMVVEPLMGVSLTVSSNTDIDVNRSHQQVDMTLVYNTTNSKQRINVTDPLSQIYTVVMQNGRRDNAVINVKPNYIQNDRLVWTHNKDLIFNGGNEYLKFEMFNPHVTSMGIDSTRFISNYYHTFLIPVEARRNYLYDETPHGAFYIRNWNNTDSEYLCDYHWVHYSIMSLEMPDDVYLEGVWTNNTFSDEYKMHYNHRKGCYEATILQKEGYYSYQALMSKDGVHGTPLPSHGNFFETQNEYQAMIYYRSPSDRTWRLVGYQSTIFKD
ncbi:MAG: DUF5103 domain-containing protein [Prevotella sp.]|nr:DUF5103 domain-containing protein [Candidatus Equicola faecalis]